MRLVCSPKSGSLPSNGDALGVLLFGNDRIPQHGAVGAAVKREILRQRLVVSPMAWDFLSLSLAVVAADCAGHRGQSPDGWTRSFDLEVAVGDPVLWNSQSDAIAAALAFLTTDRWRVAFVDGGLNPAPPAKPAQPDEDCVVLLSGGLDSLVGALDLASDARKAFAVSQLVRGDAERQITFARAIGRGLRHIQLNHNATVPEPEEPPSQRARSIVFLGYAVAAATALGRYLQGETVNLFLCENGFISVNPP